MKTRRINTAVTALALAAFLGAALTGCSSDSDAAKSPDAAVETTAPATAPAAAGACEYPPSGDAAKPVDAPAAAKTPAGTVQVKLQTSMGELTAELDADRAPCTVGSFVSLASQGYFDYTNCHRLTTAGIYVLQCGDPTGFGSGGPGYRFADELDQTASADYVPGAIAMANAGPDTNGSQFFIIYEDSTGLPPNYTVFGKLDDASLKAVQKVAAKGTKDGGPDGPPKTEVILESVKAS